MWELARPYYPYQIVGIVLLLIGVVDLFYTKYRLQRGWVRGSWGVFFREIKKNENPEEFELFLFVGIVNSSVFVGVGIVLLVVPFFL